jgi:hypothetical protein
VVQCGFGRVDITPKQPLWQAGYAARTHESSGVLTPLYARTLAIRDDGGLSAVVSTDLLGLPADVAHRIAEGVRKSTGIPRSRLLLNASHTHGGPVVGDNLRVAYGMSDTQLWQVRRYTDTLVQQIISSVKSAVGSLQPAVMHFSHASAAFGANRRLGINPNGPKDDDVPVLRITRDDGRVLGSLFGYACHNTTLGGDEYRFHGDYAGFAQLLLEERFPGSVMMYIAGCGADINPAPRGTEALARSHGAALADAVSGALSSTMRPVTEPLRAAYETPPVQFVPPPPHHHWLERLYSSNVYEQRRGRLILQQIEAKAPPSETYPFPVQVWRWGQQLTLAALAGEVVVDYALRLKSELGTDNTWVAGYSNDVFAYIPSLRVLKEGGYEGGGAMIYYGKHGPFADDIEERVVRAVHRLYAAAGRSAAP